MRLSHAVDTPTASPTAPNNRSVSTQSTSYGVLAKHVVPKKIIQHNHNKHVLIELFLLKNRKTTINMTFIHFAWHARLAQCVSPKILIQGNQNECILIEPF